MKEAICVFDNDDFKIEKLALGPFSTNAYIVTCLKKGDCILIDAPAQAEVIKKELKEKNLRYLLLTHNHMDHIGALGDFQSKKDFLLGAHPLDSEALPYPVDIMLNDGDLINFGNICVEVLHTPGHTRGSLCFRVGKILLAGDTIFDGGPGRTASPEAFRQIILSLEKKIFILPGDTRIFPGHGKPTFIKKEKEEYNIFTSRTHDSHLCGDVVWLQS